MSLRESLNQHFDHLVRTRVYVHQRPWPAFLVCGYTGLALAILLTTTLILRTGLSPWVLAAIALSACGTFLALAMATKIVTGEETLVYYYHEIAILVVVTGVLGLLRQPIPAYLDITILGVGMFLACGRVGCLMVGCCHGRPHPWGVCYRREHAEEGFTGYLVGVRLFPVQAIESLWVLGLVLVGAYLVGSGSPAGTALAWYVVMYDLGRFSLEFMRGDPERPYYGPFSEAQWISLFLVLVVAAAELAGALPLHLWHLGVAAGLTVGMLAVVVGQRVGWIATDPFLKPAHIEEVARALTPSTDTTTVQVRRTSQGLRISAGQIETDGRRVYHYALSRDMGRLTVDKARRVAGLIRLLRHPECPTELVQGQQGVFHLLVYPGAKV